MVCLQNYSNCDEQKFIFAEGVRWFGRKKISCLNTRLSFKISQYTENSEHFFRYWEMKKVNHGICNPRCQSLSLIPFA